MAQPYTDHDPEIRVEITGDEEPFFCLRLHLSPDLPPVLLHVRSAIDLSQKLQKAVCDWMQHHVSPETIAAMQTFNDMLISSKRKDRR